MRNLQYTRRHMRWALKGSEGSLADSMDYYIYFLFIVNLALEKLVGYLKNVV
jgi:hypothetical protein